MITWHQYKSNIHLKKDLWEIFFRRHDRYAVFDGVRGISVMVMILFHALYGITRLLEGEQLTAFIDHFPSWMDWAWQARGSDIFFLMCGLLVGRSLIREYIHNGKMNVPRYYKRRLMRLLPLFWLAILLHFAAVPHATDYLLSNLLFIANFIPGQEHILPIGWSMDVQMHFYILLPIIIWAAYKTRRPMLTIIIMFIAASVIRYAILLTEPQLYKISIHQLLTEREYRTTFNHLMYTRLLTRIGPFIMGLLLAEIDFHHGEKIKDYFKDKLWSSTTIFIVGAAILYIATYVPIHNPKAAFYATNNELLNLLYHACDRNLFNLGLGTLIFAVLYTNGPSLLLKRMLSWPIWHPLAELVYPIYLFHFPFIILAAVTVFGTTNQHAIHAVSNLQFVGIVLFATLYTALFSIIAHLFIEKPFLNIRNAEAPSVIPSAELAAAGAKERS